MIKLQEFARQQGVTDRAIQKHLKKYENELEGKFERRGPNGTWLSDEACDFLKGKMKAQSMEIYDSSKDEEIERLKARIVHLEEYAEGKEKYIVALEASAMLKQERIIELESAQLLLEEKRLSDMKEIEIKLQKAQEASEQLSAKLQAEEVRPLTFMERLIGKKRG